MSASIWAETFDAVPIAQAPTSDLWEHDKPWTISDLERWPDSARDPARSIWPQARAKGVVDPKLCAVCRGTGHTFERISGYSYAVECHCLDLAKLVTAYNRMGLGPEYALISWAQRGDLHPHGTDWTTASMASTRAQTKGWLAEWEPGGEGLILSGGNGLGKTHIASLICTTIATRQPRAYGTDRRPRRPVVRVVKWTRLIAEIKRGFAAKISEDKITTPLLTADLVMIDDLGEGKTTDFTRDVAERLIGSLIDDYGRPPIITTNLDPAGMAEAIGKRATSRLAGASMVLTMSGDDWRTRRSR